MASGSPVNYSIVRRKQLADLEEFFNKARSTREFVKRYLDYLSNLLTQLDTATVERIIEAFLEAGEKGSFIYFIGNGGSAATASHFANDIGIGTRAPNCKPFKAISLTDNVPVITALANDQGYNAVFVRQLEGVLQSVDVLVALSVSGNSKNVIEAVRYAKEVGALTIGCTGFDGGELKQTVDISLHIPTPPREYAPVEDIFQILDHLIYSYLRLKRQKR